MSVTPPHVWVRDRLDLVNTNPRRPARFLYTEVSLQSSSVRSAPTSGAFSHESHRGISKGEGYSEFCAKYYRHPW